MTLEFARNNTTDQVTAETTTKSLLLAHSGKQHSYQVATALQDIDALDQFYTSSYIRNSTLQQVFRDHNFWSRRFIAGLGGKKVRANWRFELPEIVLRKVLGKHPRVHQIVYYQHVNFDHYIYNIGRLAHPENPKLIADTISDY